MFLSTAKLLCIITIASSYRNKSHVYCYDLNLIYFTISYYYYMFTQRCKHQTELNKTSKELVLKALNLLKAETEELSPYKSGGLYWATYGFKWRFTVWVACLNRFGMKWTWKHTSKCFSFTTLATLVVQCHRLVCRRRLLSVFRDIFYILRSYIFNQLGFYFALASLL